MQDKKIIIAVCLLVVAATVLGTLYHVRLNDLRREAADTTSAIVYMSNALVKFRADMKPVVEIVVRDKVYRALSEGAGERLSGLEVWQIAEIILNYCLQHADIGLTPSVILAVFQQESAFDPMAVSHAGAMGLGQLMWFTARSYLDDLGYVRPEREILFNPVINAEISIRHIVRLRQYYLGIGVSDWLWPITEYFWGTGNVWKILWYAHEVMERMVKYQKRGVS